MYELALVAGNNITNTHSHACTVCVGCSKWKQRFGILSVYTYTAFLWIYALSLASSIFHKNMAVFSANCIVLCDDVCAYVRMAETKSYFPVLE